MIWGSTVYGEPYLLGFGWASTWGVCCMGLLNYFAIESAHEASQLARQHPLVSAIWDTRAALNGQVKLIPSGLEMLLSKIQSC